MPPFTHKTSRTLLPAFADENRSFLEPISYFCFNELLSFLAGKNPIRPLTPFSFSWNAIPCLWEPNSLLIGQSWLLYVGPRPRVYVLRDWGREGGSVQGHCLCTLPTGSPSVRLPGILGLPEFALPLSVGLGMSLWLYGFACNQEICLDPQNFFCSRAGPLLKPEKCSSVRVSYTNGCKRVGEDKLVCDHRNSKCDFTIPHFTQAGNLTLQA